MLTQIEFYDKDNIKNILACLSIKPDRMVFIYDKEIKDETRFMSLEKCFKRHLPNLILEKYPVDINDTAAIYSTIKMITEKYENCVMEITGGSELMIVSGVKAAIDTGIKVYYADIIEGKIVNISDKNDFIPATTLKLDDYLSAGGADFFNNSHEGPDEKDFNRILEMCEYIFRNLKQWKRTCSYLQQAMAGTYRDEIELSARSRFKARGNDVSADERMLKKMERLGFIKDLYLSPGNIAFRFENSTIKSYFINYGIWLELYVYINAVKSGIFTDVRLGAMVDWDIYDDKSVPGNEIDVVFTDNSLPVFVSCKLTEVTTAAINELVLERKRLGGWFSKAIIVTFSDEKKMKSGSYKRAMNYGIEILDKSDILSGEFGKRLVDAVRGHDLINLKWKKF